MKPDRDVDDGHDDAVQIDDAFGMTWRACKAGDRVISLDALHLMDALAALSGARSR